MRAIHLTQGRLSYCEDLPESESDAVIEPMRAV